MADLELPALPDRSPMKLSVHILPGLAQALEEYAKVYAVTYGREEPVAALVPAMLEAFLRSDRAFMRERAQLGK